MIRWSTVALVAIIWAAALGMVVLIIWGEGGCRL